MADTTNYGLLTNMASGIREGLLTYQTLKNQNRMQQLQELNAGVTQDENGNYQYTPEMQQQREAKAGLLQGQLAASKHQQALMDPNSQESMSVRQSVKSLLPKEQQGAIADTLSGTEAEKLAGLYGTGIKTNASNIHFDIGQGNKEDSRWSQAAEKFSNPSARSTLGRYQQNLDKANTLDTLINKVIGGGAVKGETEQQTIQRLNKADPSQLYEAAKAADALTSSAQNTVYGTDHLMPKGMDIQSSLIHQWLPKELGGGGQPIPANAGEHIYKFFKQAMAEKEYFNQAMEDAKSGLAVGYEDLQKKDPARWKRMTNPSMFRVQEQPAQAPQQPQDQGAANFEPDVVQYAREHNITPAAAQVIKQRRTMGNEKAQGQAPGLGGGIINSISKFFGG